MPGRFIYYNRHHLFIDTISTDISDQLINAYCDQKKQINQICLVSENFSNTEKTKLEQYFEITTEYTPKKGLFLIVKDNSIKSIFKTLKILKINIHAVNEHLKLAQTIENDLNRQTGWLKNAEFYRLPVSTQAFLGLKHKYLYQENSKKSQINMVIRQFIMAHLGRDQDKKDLLSKFNVYKRVLPTLNRPPQTGKWKTWTGNTNPMIGLVGLEGNYFSKR